MRRDLFDLMRTGLKALNQPEYFVNGPNMKSNQFASENFFLVIISIVVIQILILIFGKWLWNNVATKLITGLRPASNIWQILGLAILIKLITN